MVVPVYNPFWTFIRKFLKFPMYYALFLRGLFTIDIVANFMIRYFSPLITMIFILGNQHYPQQFNARSCAISVSIIGCHFISMDTLGTKIVEHIFTAPNPILSITTLLVSNKSKNPLVHFVNTSSIWGTFIGPGKMTVAGRVTLTTAAFSGASWLGNEYLNRRERIYTANADRAATDQRTDADRRANFKRDLYEMELKSYEKRYEVWLKSPVYSRGLPPMKPTSPEL